MRHNPEMEFTEDPGFVSPMPDISTADSSRWMGREPEPLKFTIAGLVPEGMTTLLVGEGGAGKTLLMQTAMTAIPTGQPFLRKETASGATAGVFAEDPEAVLHLRQQRINQSLGVDMEALVGRAFVQSYVGYVPYLWRDGAPAPFMAQLEAQLGQIPELRLLVIDNAALVYADDENGRVPVTGFINALNGIAHRLTIGIILSTHVSKSKDGSSLRAASGSTAWINACRSVLKLETGADDTATLTLIKANHTKPGATIDLEWRNGVLVARAEPDTLDKRARSRRLAVKIFDLIEQGWEDGVPYGTAPQTGHRYLPSAVARQSEFKVREVEQAMVALIDNRFIKEDRKSARTPKGLRAVKVPDVVQAARKGRE